VRSHRKCELANRDFRDLWHLLPKSRMKWQRRLSAKVAWLVKRYHLQPAITPSPSASPSAQPSAPPSVSDPA
jgi:hypothetical protein